MCNSFAKVDLKKIKKEYIQNFSSCKNYSELVGEVNLEVVLLIWKLFHLISRVTVLGLRVKVVQFCIKSVKFDGLKFMIS